MTRPCAARGTVLALALAMAAVAQTSPANRLGIAERMKQNGEALQHYTYKRRTEIIKKGEPRGARVDLIRYVNGHKETIPLETPERADRPPGGRGLRRKIVERKMEKKKEEMKAEMERLKGLMDSYLSPGSHAMAALLGKAQISRTGSGPDADIRLTVAGLNRPADSLTMVWSVVKRHPVKIEIRTDDSGKPVQLDIDYSTLPGGAFYPARIVISAPKKNLTLTITTFDYVLSPEAGCDHCPPFTPLCSRARRNSSPGFQVGNVGTLAISNPSVKPKSAICSMPAKSQSS